VGRQPIGVVLNNSRRSAPPLPAGQAGGTAFAAPIRNRKAPDNLRTVHDDWHGPQCGRGGFCPGTDRIEMNVR
jgi:hypothetical protein